MDKKDDYYITFLKYARERMGAGDGTVDYSHMLDHVRTTGYWTPCGRGKVGMSWSVNALGIPARARIHSVFPFPRTPFTVSGATPRAT